MPRYFFHVYDDIVAPDEEGQELPNPEAARLKALEGARELIAEQVRHGYIARSHCHNAFGVCFGWKADAATLLAAPCRA